MTTKPTPASTSPLSSIGSNALPAEFAGRPLGAPPPMDLSGTPGNLPPALDLSGNTDYAVPPPPIPTTPFDMGLSMRAPAATPAAPAAPFKPTTYAPIPLENVSTIKQNRINREADAAYAASLSAADKFGAAATTTGVGGLTTYAMELDKSDGVRRDRKYDSMAMVIQEFQGEFPNMTLEQARQLAETTDQGRFEFRLALMRGEEKKQLDLRAAGGYGTFAKTADIAAAIGLGIAGPALVARGVAAAATKLGAGEATVAGARAATGFAGEVGTSVAYGKGSAYAAGEEYTTAGLLFDAGLGTLAGIVGFGKDLSKFRNAKTNVLERSGKQVAQEGGVIVQHADELQATGAKVGDSFEFNAHVADDGLGVTAFKTKDATDARLVNAVNGDELALESLAADARVGSLKRAKELVESAKEGITSIRVGGEVDSLMELALSALPKAERFSITTGSGAALKTVTHTSPELDKVLTTAELAGKSGLFPSERAAKASAIAGQVDAVTAKLGLDPTDFEAGQLERIVSKASIETNKAAKEAAKSGRALDEDGLLSVFESRVRSEANVQVAANAEKAQAVAAEKAAKEAEKAAKLEAKQAKAAGTAETTTDSASVAAKAEQKALAEQKAADTQAVRDAQAGRIAARERIAQGTDLPAQYVDEVSGEVKTGLLIEDVMSGKLADTRVGKIYTEMQSGLTDFLKGFSTEDAKALVEGGFAALRPDVLKALLVSTVFKAEGNAAKALELAKIADETTSAGRAITMLEKLLKDYAQDIVGDSAHAKLGVLSEERLAQLAAGTSEASRDITRAIEARLAKAREAEKAAAKEAKETKKAGKGTKAASDDTVKAGTTVSPGGGTEVDEAKTLDDFVTDFTRAKTVAARELTPEAKAKFDALARAHRELDDADTAGLTKLANDLLATDGLLTKTEQSLLSDLLGIKKTETAAAKASDETAQLIKAKDTVSGKRAVNTGKKVNKAAELTPEAAESLNSMRNTVFTIASTGLNKIGEIKDGFFRVSAAKLREALPGIGMKDGAKTKNLESGWEKAAKGLTDEQFAKEIGIKLASDSPEMKSIVGQLNAARELGSDLKTALRGLSDDELIAVYQGFAKDFNRGLGDIVAYGIKLTPEAEKALAAAADGKSAVSELAKAHGLNDTQAAAYVSSRSAVKPKTVALGVAGAALVASGSASAASGQDDGGMGALGGFLIMGALLAVAALSKGGIVKNSRAAVAKAKAWHDDVPPASQGQKLVAKTVSATAEGFSKMVQAGLTHGVRMNAHDNPVMRGIAGVLLNDASGGSVGRMRGIGNLVQGFRGDVAKAEAVARLEGSHKLFLDNAFKLWKESGIEGAKIGPDAENAFMDALFDVQTKLMNDFPDAAQALKAIENRAVMPSTGAQVPEWAAAYMLNKAADEGAAINRLIATHEALAKQATSMGKTYVEPELVTTMREVRDAGGAHPGYTSRMHNAAKIQQYISLHSEAAVVKLYAESMRTSKSFRELVVAKGEEAANKDIEQRAQAFVTALKRVGSKDSFKGLSSQEFIAKLKDEGASDSVLDMIRLHAGDQVQSVSGVAKAAADLNLNASVRFISKEGVETELFIADLIRKDPVDAMQRWSTSVAGEIALGQASYEFSRKTGRFINFSSESDFRQLVDEAVELGRTDTELAISVRDQDLMLEVWKDLKGVERAQSFRAASDGSIAALRAGATLVSAANFVMAAVPEFVTNFSYRVLRDNKFSYFTESVRGLVGKASTAEDLNTLKEASATLGGLNFFGVSNWSSYGELGERVAGVNGVLNKGIDTMFRATGMTGMSAATEGMAKGKLLYNVYHNASDPNMIKTFEAMGFSADDLQRMNGFFKKYATLTEAGTPEMSIATHNKAALEAPFEYGLMESLMGVAGSRASTRSAGLGDTTIALNNPVLSLVFQFMNAPIMATYRTFSELNHMQAAVLYKYMVSSVAGAASYVIRTSIQHAGDEEALDKKLSPGQIAVQSMKYASMSGVLPNFVDMASTLAGQGKVFDGVSGRGSNVQGIGGQIATVNAVGSVLNAGAAIRDLITGEDVTKAQAKQLRVLFPHWGLQGLVNFMVDTSDMPTKKPRQTE